MSLPVSLENPRQNWIRESRFGFVQWMDGFPESEILIWIRIRQIEYGLNHMCGLATPTFGELNI